LFGKLFKFNVKIRKMKKAVIFVFIMIFTLSASTLFAVRPDHKSASENTAIPNKTENKLSEEELSRLTKRVEEIRDMDKTNMTGKEKRELRKELKSIKENVRRDGSVIYIGGGTLLLIIILLVILL
jgi:hypothetical protein